MADQLALGIELIRQVENEKAITVLKKVVETEPQNSEGYRHLGLAYSNIGEYSEALENWNRCLDLDPLNHQTWWNFGQLHESLGDFEQAFHAYTKAEKTAHDFPAKASRYKEWAKEVKKKIR